MNRVEKLINFLIGKHKELSGKAVILTRDIEILSRNVTGLNAINEQIENRDRLINLIDRIQQEIDVAIENYGSSIVNTPIYDELNSWARGFNLEISNIIELDEQIENNLMELKSETEEEISRIYKARNLFKGYNLNNLK